MMVGGTKANTRPKSGKSPQGSYSLSVPPLIDIYAELLKRAIYTFKTALLAL